MAVTIITSRRSMIELWPDLSIETKQCSVIPASDPAKILMQTIRKAGLQADVSAGLGNLYLPKWAGRALRLDGIHPKMVPHVRALDPEDHVLRDIGGVVGYPFQVAGDEQRIQRLLGSLF